jgi:hypothetical protein
MNSLIMLINPALYVSKLHLKKILKKPIVYDMFSTVNKSFFYIRLKKLVN